MDVRHNKRRLHTGKRGSRSHGGRTSWEGRAQMARTWIRLYTELPNVAKIQRLPAHLFQFLINCWCLTGEADDELLPDTEELAWRLHIDPEICAAYVTHLHTLGLLEAHGEKLQPHNWDSRQFVSDDSKERVSKFRKNKQVIVGNDSVTANVTKCNAVDTDSDSETDSEQTQMQMQRTRKPETDSDIATLAESLHARHPANGCGKATICKKLKTILDKTPPSRREETIRLIDENHAAWCQTDNWQRGFPKGLENWLSVTMERWKDPPSKTIRPKTLGEQIAEL